jgi:hypothetical protein
VSIGKEFTPIGTSKNGFRTLVPKDLTEKFFLGHKIDVSKLRLSNALGRILKDPWEDPQNRVSVLKTVHTDKTN